MPRRHTGHSRRARLVAALVTLLVPASALALAGPSARAVTGSPPVTAPDSAGTAYAGVDIAVEPLTNDSDPDGDELEVCRVGKDTPRGIRLDRALLGADKVLIRTSRKARPGTYTLTYYACDLSYLTAGTITLTVEKAPEVTVEAIASRPGFIRVTNPADFAVVMFYGPLLQPEGPDGRVRVAAGRSKAVRVHRHDIYYFITGQRGVAFATQGQVRGIELPPGDGPHNIDHTNSRSTTAWPAR